MWVRSLTEQRKRGHSEAKLTWAVLYRISSSVRHGYESHWHIYFLDAELTHAIYQLNHTIPFAHKLLIGFHSDPFTSSQKPSPPLPHSKPCYTDKPYVPRPKAPDQPLPPRCPPQFQTLPSPLVVRDEQRYEQQRSSPARICLVSKRRVGLRQGGTLMEKKERAQV
jgi:hypothetical protein